MKSTLVHKLVSVFSLVFFLTSCGADSDTGISPSSPVKSNNNTTVERIIPGKTECDYAGDISPDGKYVCAGRGMFYWVLLQDLATNVSENTSNNSDSGYWTTECRTVEVANPNYNASKGFSAVVNEPTIRTQECSQVWISD
jgi:hypothetical protein